MIEVTFIEHNGTQRKIEVGEGTSLMEAAVSNLVPGIDGDCGGACACATCHVYIHPDWLDRIEPMEEHERSMLSLSEGVDDRSRLACQIKLNTDLTGIVVQTPEGQH